MDPRIRIIKHGNQKPKAPELDRLEHSSLQGTREISGTIKLWVSEFKERRRIEEHQTRTTIKLILTALQ